MKIKNLTLCGIFASIMCISAFFSITLPFTTIPFTLQVCAFLIASSILGPKLGAMTQIIYLLIGVVGLPVFSGFRSGIGHLTGITGGFLVGFIPGAIIIGFLTQKLFIYRKKFIFQYASIFISMCFGLLVVYMFGAVQYSAVTGAGILRSVTITVAPFMWIDLIKIALSAYLVREVKLRLGNAKI